MKKLFNLTEEKIGDRYATVVSGLGEYNLMATLECGQAFRHELIRCEGEYVEYLTVISDLLVTVGQRKPGELIFYRISREVFESRIKDFFTLDVDYEKIKNEIISVTDSKWLKEAATYSGGIAILKQDPWEALFSFIISQNNNIPRIRKIIRQICAAYGVNLCLQSGINKCPLGKINGVPCHEKCESCGTCYSFPSCHDILTSPEKLLLSRPGFRYKYLVDAAGKVCSGEVSLEDIAKKESYEYTVESLKQIKGVGDKVASCVALFGFSNLDAFPVDVWMKRAIDEYFGGNLDYKALGKYAGVAQQYIFHYIRYLNGINNGEQKPTQS